jgi:hypothetical protein
MLWREQTDDDLNTTPPRTPDRMTRRQPRRGTTARRLMGSLGEEDARRIADDNARTNEVGLCN